VAALIEHLGIGPATVVGYSMGGPIAQLVWRRHPEAVAGLVMCATAARFARRQQLSGPIGTLGLGASLAISLLPAAVRRQGMTFATRNWNSNSDAADWAIEEWQRHDPSALLQAGLALSKYDSTGWIGETDVPASVVVTALDTTVSPRRQWYLAQAIPGAVAFPVQGDHRACVDAVKIFVPALIAACESAQAGDLPVARPSV
jgi:3-oxoadipate enol-lactonase